MKLITEDFLNDEVAFITEGSGDAKKTYLEGIFMQAEKKNRNGRLYTRTVLSPAVDRYISEKVNTGRAVGELGHPEGPAINLDKVSHRIIDLHWEGNNVIGKALVLEDTICGDQVLGLLKGGVKLGVSSRGMGSLEKTNSGMMVKNDFILATVDIVQDPSATEAFVNGIMEGVEFYIKGKEIIAERIQKKIHNTPSNRLDEAMIQAFQTFLAEIKAK